MSRRVAVVGSGIVGTTVAYLLTRAGIEVDVFERGPEFPYPPTTAFERIYVGFTEDLPPYDEPPEDLNNVVQSGDYNHPLREENISCVGGKATNWGARTPRMAPDEFKIRSKFGYGVDWPIDYAELEPYYCKAESYLGVSGAVDDNPFAPPRSKPYPLPAFPLNSGALAMRDLLKPHGIALSGIPQARTSQAYEGRPACLNYGACFVCPIGARYFPQHHLRQALATNRCRLHTNTTVRRIDVPQADGAVTIVFREGNSTRELELHADAVIVAAGPIETARLLLLSKTQAFPDGLGNHAGHVGKHYFMHHVTKVHVDAKPFLFNGRSVTGAVVGNQFLTSSERGRVGGFMLNVGHETWWPAHTKHEWLMGGDNMSEWITGKDIIEEAREAPHCQFLGFDAEVLPGDGKYIALSDRVDRFGDPFASVHYDLDDFDRATLAAGTALVERVAHLIDGEITRKKPSVPHSGHHHHGGTRMSSAPRDGVVDPLGRVHGIRNLFVLGGATFPSFSAVNPTLTMVAHAIRTCEALVEQLK